MNLSRLSMSFIDAADFSGEKKTGRSEAGGGDIFRDLFFELPTELKKSISRDPVLRDWTPAEVA